VIGLSWNVILFAVCQICRTRWGGVWISAGRRPASRLATMAWRKACGWDRPPIQTSALTGNHLTLLIATIPMPRYIGCYVLVFIAFDVLRYCWLGDKKGIRPVQIEYCHASGGSDPTAALHALEFQFWSLLPLVSCCSIFRYGFIFCYWLTQFVQEYWPLKEWSFVVWLAYSFGTCSSLTCPKGHLSETYRHRVGLELGLELGLGLGLELGIGLGLASNFGNCTTPFRRNDPSDKRPFGQVTCNRLRFLATKFALWTLGDGKSIPAAKILGIRELTLNPRSLENMAG